MYNTKSQPNVNYGLWMIMTSQCRFITCKKGITLVGDTDNGGFYACMYLGNLCTFCSIFCESKTAQKNDNY